MSLVGAGAPLTQLLTAPVRNQMYFCVAWTQLPCSWHMAPPATQVDHTNQRRPDDKTQIDVLHCVCSNWRRTCSAFELQIQHSPTQLSKWMERVLLQLSEQE